MSKQYITGYFEDEVDLKTAIKQLKEKNIPIKDVFTPFPVHGLEHVLEYKKSHLPKVAFFAGGLGAAVALGFQTWIFTIDYPINFGGKPFFSLPSFIPVTFELTVLFAAFSMVFAFLFRSGLGMGAKNKIWDERITDDRFLILLEPENQNKDDYKSALEATGALDVKFQEN
jgi:hypothetical protein